MKKSITYAILITATCPFAASAEAVVSEAIEAPSSKESKPFDASCMASAVELREQSLAQAFTKFTNTQTNLMTARKTALLTAIHQPNARLRAEARKTAWKTFRDASKRNHTELAHARITIWNQYKKSMRTCPSGYKELSGENILPTLSVTESL
jgi:hypothetical protein